MDDSRARCAASSLAPAVVFLAWLGFLVCVVDVAGAVVGAVPPWQRALSNWDTGWYLSIVDGGYQSEIVGESNVAFFPVYPLLVRWLSKLGGDPVAAGVGLSLTCFLAALAVLRRLLLEKCSKRVASSALLLLAFWPFSFFFALVYTESLFLLLAVGAFYLVHRQRWWAAAACAALASGTRVVGAFVALGVVVAFVQQASWRPTPRYLAKTAGLAAAGLAGLFAFAAYLYAHTGNALAFVEAQRYWHNRAEGIAGLEWIAEVLLHHPLTSYTFVSVVFYLVPFVLFLGLSVFVLLRRDVAWGVFSTLTLIAPVPTGSLTSTNRYVLILFPCFAALAELVKDKAPVVVAVFAALLGLFVYRYFFHPGLFIG